MKTPAIFPFNLSRFDGDALFKKYVKNHYPELVEKHGYQVFVGGPNPYKRSWSYYEVDVTVIGPTTVEYQTYDMLNGFSGGRGKGQEKFTETFESEGVLSAFVEKRKRYLAEVAFIRAQEEEAERKRREGIDAMYEQMFGKVAA